MMLILGKVKFLLESCSERYSFCRFEGVDVQLGRRITRQTRNQLHKLGGY